MEDGGNIILIGFMGSGKSAVGMRLAHRLKWEFVDMDREIERITGMSITELFRRHGELRFRSEESLLVRRLCRREHLVIATGGGVLLQDDNITLLQAGGRMVYLEASAAEIFRRVSRKKNSRPMLKKGFTVEDIAQMLAEREVVYRQAELQVNTEGREVEQIVNEIVGYFRPSGGRKGHSGMQ